MKSLCVIIALNLLILVRLWFRDKAFDHLDDDIMAEREQVFRDAAVVFCVIISIVAVIWSIIEPEG